MRITRRVSLVLGLVAVLSVGAVALAQGPLPPPLPPQAQTPCTVACQVDFHKCASFCGRRAECFVACSTLLEICLEGCSVGEPE